MNFDIHNLIKLTIEGTDRKYLDYIGAEYAFFKTEAEVDPDVRIIIVDSVYPDSGCQLIDNKYLIGSGYLYCRDRYKVAGWTFSINELEAKTSVHFSGGIWGEHILNDFIIEPLISFKLAVKGYCTLHASAISIDDAGFVFAGEPEAGKTAAILSLNLHNNNFLSDEITLLSKNGVIYSFPSPIRIYHHNLVDMSHHHQITPWQNFEARLKHIVHVSSLRYVKLPLIVNADKLFRQVGKECTLRCLILLTRIKDDKISVTEITDKKELVKRIVTFTEQQFPYWLKYASAYSSIYPSSQVASYSQLMVNNLTEALDKIACYEIKTPYNFTESHRGEFQQVIQNLKRHVTD